MRSERKIGAVVGAVALGAAALTGVGQLGLGSHHAQAVAVPSRETRDANASMTPRATPTPAVRTAEMPTRSNASATRRSSHSTASATRRSSHSTATSTTGGGGGNLVLGESDAGDSGT